MQAPARQISSARHVIAAGAALIALASGAARAQEEGAPAPSLTPASEVSQPEGWADELAMAEPVDLDPDPHVLEFNLEARVEELEILPGVMTPAWTYNGSLPGPLIRAQVGDRLVVHFTNSLPEPTTIHWHGLRVPNDMDGAPGLTQEPVPPGGTFEYAFTLPDAGTFWYHPHFNSPHQVSRGLYGAIVVEDPDEPFSREDELVLVLSDIALNEDGSFKPSDRGGAFGDLFGREGDVLLVNGRVRPTLKARAGKPQRWRVINAAITRYFPVALRHHRWRRIGGDGGLMAHSEELPRMVLAAAERADLIFTPVDDPGATREFGWLPPDRGFGTATGRTRIPLFDIATVEDAAVAPGPPPETQRAIPPIDLSNAIEKRVELTIDTSAPREDIMGINGVAHDYRIDARVGETQVWEVVNTTDFDHPFHLHGFFFQVLDEDRVPEWKDTINVPQHATVRIATTFDDRPGMWMLHCHILDHAEVGMMGHLRVMERGAPGGSD